MSLIDIPQPIVLIPPLEVQNPLETLTAANGTRFNKLGHMEAVADNSPRYDYDPLTGLYLGRLFGEERTNSLLDSSDPSTGDWTSDTEISFTTGKPSIIKGQTAVQVTDDGTGVDTQYRQNLTLTGNDDTFSAILEQGDVDDLQIGIRDPIGSVWVIRAKITWADESFVINDGSGSVKVKKLADSGPNGGKVLRISVTGSGIANNPLRAVLYPTTAASQAGHIFHHNAQVELGASFPTSPIITAGSAVTRNADVSTITDLSWYNQSEGAFLVEFTTGFDVGSCDIINLSDGTNNNSIRIFTNANSVPIAGINSDNGDYGNMVGSTLSPNTTYRQALSFAEGRAVFVQDGSIVDSKAVGSPPVGLTKMSFGHRWRLSDNWMNGHIKYGAYFSRDLTDASIQAFTR